MYLSTSVDCAAAAAFGFAWLCLPEVRAEPIFGGDFWADLICFGVNLADCLVDDFFAVDCRGDVAFFDCGVATFLVTEGGFLGIEGGFLA